jgi:nucleoside-diphosphate-sugar epimerase
LRLPIVQGEGDVSLRLWAYLERLLDGGPVLLPEGGAELVRFVDARDVGRAVVRLLEDVPPRAAAYNLAQPDVVTLREFLERVATEAGVRPRFVDVSWSEALAAGLEPAFSPYATRWRSLLDPSAAAGEWGFLAARTEAYLPRVVRWHLEHRPSAHHPGYAGRDLEKQVASRVAGV